MSTVEHHPLHLLFHSGQRLHGGTIRATGALRRVVLRQLRLHVEPRPERGQMRVICRWDCWSSKDKDTMVQICDIRRYENLQCLQINREAEECFGYHGRTYRRKRSACTVRNCKISIKFSDQTVLRRSKCEEQETKHNTEQSCRTCSKGCLSTSAFRLLRSCSHPRGHGSELAYLFPGERTHTSVISSITRGWRIWGKYSHTSSTALLQVQYKLFPKEVEVLCVCTFT